MGREVKKRSKFSDMLVVILNIESKAKIFSGVRVKCYHMFPLVTTGYHLAPSEKTMLPQVTDQSKMAKRFDSSSFRAIHPPGAEK